MKAWILKKTGQPYVLEYEETPLPDPQADEVRLRMKAISLNPVDYKIAQGAFSLPTPRVIGIDAAGEIDAIGADVRGFAPGQRVFCLLDLFHAGAFADYANVKAAAVSRMPAALSFERAAVLPCAGITAWQAVINKLHVTAGQRVFISAGGGGVGGFAIQIAKRRGAEVLTTASRNAERLYELGADHVIDYTQESIIDRVNDITQYQGVHAVIDMISGQSAAELSTILRHNGGIACIAGLPKEYPVPPFTTAISIHDVALGAAYQHGDTENLREMATIGETMADMIVEGKLDPMISEVLEFSQIPEGLQRLFSRHVKGKLVVKVA